MRPLLMGMICLVLGGMVTSASAQGFPESLQIHGFGTWGWGDTDGNSYQFGNQDGNYENASFTLNANAAVSERLTVAGQVGWETFGDELETELDYIFAEWRFSDTLRLRLGQVKHPFGIYTEVFDVGTVRPFLNLPLGVYGPQGMVAEAYRGIGVFGELYGASGWGVQYDVYGGEIESPVDHPIFVSFAALGEEPVDPFDLDSIEVLGGRLNISTPLEGLGFGVSGYTGEPDPSQASNSLTESLDLENRRTVLGGHVEYLGNALWVRSEYATLDVGNTDVKGYYAEVAYKLDPHWQVAVRYDGTDVDGVVIDPPIDVFDILDHEDVAGAVNYWFSANLVVKLEYHLVDGMRFTGPPADDVTALVLTGAPLDTETELIQLGAQFSF